MLPASALWRWAAPAMVRSSATCVVSNSTGRITPGGKRGAARPWTSRGSILGAHSPYRSPCGGPLGSGPDSSAGPAGVARPKGGQSPFRCALGAAVDDRQRRRRIAGVAAHRGRAAIHLAELLEREGAARGQAGMDVTLE